FLTTAIFEGWSGDYSGNSPTATVLMNGPKTVKAVWRTDSSQLFMLGASIPILAAVFYVIARRRAKAGSDRSKNSRKL
ncbi:MAG: hypothetical protein NZ570_06155, partial [Candidatus Caldarchaeum sp.]|nr:hypothetical protein [Candidatus Caldarchaeum sp.]